MLNFKGVFRGLWLVTCLLTMTFGKLSACDRTAFVLDSVVADGGNFRLHASVCIGGGILGADQGAGNWTESLYFFAWGPAGMNCLAFSPDSVRSDTTGCTLAATPLGALSGLPLLGDVDFALAYLPASPCQYSCVSANGTCGAPHSDCKQLTFTFTEMPDSILMLGAEGGGNLFGGCWPDNDLMIDFTTLPVTWAEVSARQVQNLVQVDWVTEFETNNDHFEILRSRDGEDWREIGRMDSRGNASERTSYSFLDPVPFEGTNYYRIVQVDANGGSTESKVVKVHFRERKRGFKWFNLSPNPGNGPLNLSFYATRSELVTLELLSAEGKLEEVQQLDVQEGKNEIVVFLNASGSGVYLLRLRGGQGIIQHKLVRF